MKPSFREKDVMLILYSFSFHNREVSGKDEVHIFQTLHKKWSFLLSISSVNVTKSAGNCAFGHIYWRNPQWKTSFFMQWKITLLSTHFSGMFRSLLSCNLNFFMKTRLLFISWWIVIERILETLAQYLLILQAYNSQSHSA